MSKLQKTLEVLDNSSFKAFSRYIHSPYFCQHQEVRNLLDMLEQTFPDFPASLYTTYTDSYPGTSKSRFNVLKTYLLKHLYNFLAQERFQSQIVLQKSLLVDGLREKGLLKDAAAQLEGALHAAQEQAQIDSGHFYQLVKLRELELDLAISGEARSKDLSLDPLFEALDHYQQCMGLKYLLPALAMERLFSNRFPTERLRAYREMTSLAAGQPKPLIQMFDHLLYLLQGHSRNEHLPQILDILEQHGDRFSKIERINIYGYLQNYFTQGMLRGEADALPSLFELYRDMDRYGLVFGQGDFSGHLFRNIVVIGCRLSELEWTSQFLEQNRKAIAKELGGTALAYGEAYLEFYKGRYSASMKRLQQLEFVDPFYRTGHQVLLLRNYYELGEFELLESLGRTFRRFLNRTDTMSESHKEKNRNFLSVLHQLAKAKEKGPDPVQIQKIAALLELEGELTDRTWLGEKLRELR